MAAEVRVNDTTSGSPLKYKECEKHYSVSTDVQRTTFYNPVNVFRRDFSKVCAVIPSKVQSLRDTGTEYFKILRLV